MGFVRKREKAMLGLKYRNTSIPPEVEEQVKEKEQGRMWRAFRLGVRQYIHLYDNLKLDFEGLEAAIADDKAFEEMVRQNGGKVPEPPEENAEADSQTGTQEQTDGGGEAKVSQDKNGAQDDEDMKEADTTGDVSTAKTDATAAGTSTSSSPSPTEEAAATTGAMESQDNKTEHVDDGSVSSTDTAVDAEAVMDNDPALDHNSSSA
jgi:hypothetical protein